MPIIKSQKPRKRSVITDCINKCGRQVNLRYTQKCRKCRRRDAIKKGRIEFKKRREAKQR